MEQRKENEATKLVSEDDPSSACCAKCPDALRVNTKLLPYKAQFLFFYGAIACVLPFLSVYFKQLGMNPSQIGIVYSIRSFIGWITSPIWGAIADRFRMRKVVLLISIVAWVVSFLVIAHLPPAEEKNDCPIGLPPDTNSSAVEIELIQGYELVRGWMYVSSGVTNLFYMITIATILGEIFWSPIGALSDAALLSILPESDLYLYPKQRAWGAFGAAFLQLATGKILDLTITHREVCGLDLSFTDYRLAFYIFATSMGMAFIVSSTFKFKYNGAEIENTKPLQEVARYHQVYSDTFPAMVNSGDETNNKIVSMDNYSHEAEQGNQEETKFNLKKLVKLLCTVHYLSWLMCICYMGFCNGVILGFLFWYLQELGGTGLVMGVAGGLASGTEFLFFFISHWFVQRVGTVNTLYISLLVYALRFLNYAAISNPWLVLPSEVLQGFTFSAGWAALVQHASDAVPYSSLAAIMGTVHGIYWGLGLGAGNLVGGILINTIGAKDTYALLSGISVIMTCLFCLAQKLSVRKVYEDIDCE